MASARRSFARAHRATFEQLEDRCLLAGVGLTGQYFDNADLSSLKLTRTDAAIDFDWGGGAPATGIGADTFSVRWTKAGRGKVSRADRRRCDFCYNRDSKPASPGPRVR